MITIILMSRAFNRWVGAAGGKTKNARESTPSLDRGYSELAQPEIRTRTHTHNVAETLRSRHIKTEATRPAFVAYFGLERTNAKQ